MPRDQNATFEPKIVAKRKRRLSGIDELVISLSAKGLTTGDVQAHLAEVYGADVSRQTISAITDKVIEAWPSGRTDPWTTAGLATNDSSGRAPGHAGRWSHREKLESVHRGRLVLARA